MYISQPLMLIDSKSYFFIFNNKTLTKMFDLVIIFINLHYFADHEQKKKRRKIINLD